MRKYYLFLILLLLFIDLGVSAQTYSPPINYAFQTKADYVKYEADVISTVDWMQQTQWSDQQEKQVQAKKFLTDWATGSPYVTVNISQPLLRLCKRNPELLLTYMGQFVKYALEHKTNFNKTQANIFAIRALLAKYNMETDRRKDTAVEKLIATDQQGKLGDWVKNDMNEPE